MAISFDLSTRKNTSEAENSNKKKKRKKSVPDDVTNSSAAAADGICKRRKKDEKSPAEISSEVEHVLAELEVAAEEDAQLNRESRPAVNKLKKLPLLRRALSSCYLQEEFLDHGVLGLLKSWLEPLPDRSLPNSSVRTAVLEILDRLPIDLNRSDRREQVKKSGIGKVIMFFSKSEEETAPNRRLAREIVERWSRVLLFTNKEEEKVIVPNRVISRSPGKTLMIKDVATLDFDRDDLDDFSRVRVPKSEDSAEMINVSRRPEVLPLEFVSRPMSKIDPEEVRARAKLNRDECRMRIDKSLRKLKDPRRRLMLQCV